MWKKYGTHIWDTGHKTVALFRGASITPLHTILRVEGDGVQKHHTQVLSVQRVSVSVRNTVQAYLNLVDWRHIQEGGPQGNAKDWTTSMLCCVWCCCRTATSRCDATASADYYNSCKSSDVSGVVVGHCCHAMCLPSAFQ